jgi:hypothetical protein
MTPKGYLAMTRAILDFHDVIVDMEEFLCRLDKARRAGFNDASDRILRRVTERVVAVLRMGWREAYGLPAAELTEAERKARTQALAALKTAEQRVLQRLAAAAGSVVAN